MKLSMQQFTTARTHSMVHKVMDFNANTAINLSAEQSSLTTLQSKQRNDGHPENENKKLRYREEHSASIMLSWCTLRHFSGENLLMAIT